MGLDHLDGHADDAIQKALDDLVQVILEPVDGAGHDLSSQEQEALEQLVQRVKERELYRLLHE